MRFRTHVPLVLATATLLGCGSDRVAGPSDEATRAAAALERAAAEAGIGVDPTAALTYRTVAAALRGGAPVSEVEISVDGGLPQPWHAFGHEIRFEPATGGGPADLFGESSFRALLAWRVVESEVHVIYLLANGNEGAIGDVFPATPLDGTEIELPSTLIYSEGRNLFWVGARGTQTNALVNESRTPCPAPRRPAGAPPAPTCVIASFNFGFSGAEAEPPGFLFGPNGPAPSQATGTRRLSMAAQQVGGTVMTIDFRTLDLPALAPDSRP
jgi:hypothetical protein